jgi:UDPglucose 6-dehydrogenase
MQILVVGLGYVGSVVATGLARDGHQVTGIDIDSTKVDSLKFGRPRAIEPGLADLAADLQAKQYLNLCTLKDIKTITQPIVMICVGTLADRHGKVDLSGVISTIKWIIFTASAKTSIVMKSTVPPGTGRTIVKDYLSSVKIKHHYLANPEFLSEGRALDNWFNPDRIIIGTDDAKSEYLDEIYSTYRAPVITH